MTPIGSLGRGQRRGVRHGRRQQQIKTLLSYLVVQWFGVGLMIKRSLVRLPAGALSSHLGQLSLPSLRGR